MSTNYFILWEHRSMNTIGSLNDVHFYAIETEGKLRYLGLAFGLDLKAEIQDSLKTFGLNGEQVSIVTGNIVRNIHNYVNRQLAEEVLCLMVNKVKPTCNIICNQSYYGRDGLEIHNRGYQNVPASLSTKTIIPQRLTGS